MNMTAEIKKIEQSIEWGEIAIKEYKATEEVPAFVYERMMFLYKEEIRILKEQQGA